MKRILLLADDSATIQRVIQLIFADEGFDVIAVGDGEQAVEHLERMRPDIVLADVSMPKLTGYDLCAYVKSAPQLAGIPVVLLTGAFERLDEVRAREGGYSGAVSKPIDPERVVRLVHHLLDNKSAQPTVEPYQEPAPMPPADRSTSAGEYLEEVDRAFADAGFVARQPETLVSEPAPLALQVTDELVDEVSRRVLEKLSSQIVHELVTARVLNLAERLVREEIDRVRASVPPQ